MPKRKEEAEPKMFHNRELPARKIHPLFASMVLSDSVLLLLFLLILENRPSLGSQISL